MSLSTAIEDEMSYEPPGALANIPCEQIIGVSCSGEGLYEDIVMESADYFQKQQQQQQNLAKNKHYQIVHHSLSVHVNPYMKIILM